MGRQLAPLFFAAFLAYGYNNIFMTLTPSFVVAAGGTLAEAGLQNSVYLAAAVLLRFAFGPAAETLTEELLREIYRIPLTVADIPVPGGSVKGCVYDA